MNRARRLWRFVLGALVGASLCGCAAIAPLAAAGALANRERDEVAPAPADAEPAPAPIAEIAAPELPVVSTTAGEALDPASPDPFTAFARYAISKAPPAPPGEPRQSALLDQDSVGNAPRRQTCGDQPPAVVIDLDPAGRAFDPDNPPRPAPGLAEQLTAMRMAGVTVLWAASTGVSEAQKVYTVLQATALDPERTDRLLLLRRGDDRKQARRMAAARDWCVVAIAGDARGDFDELYDYLVDPSGSVAEALAPNFGAGWFLVPAPIE